MLEPRTCHLPHSTAPVCIGVDCSGQPEAPHRHSADIIVSGMTELGGQR